MDGTSENQSRVTPILQRKDGTVRVENEVRQMLRQALKRGGDRRRIAQAMTGLLGRTVTVSMLADFTRNATKKRQPRFPLAWTPALCRVTNDQALARFALSEQDRRVFEIGECVLESKHALEKALTKLGEANPGKTRRARR